MTKVLTVRIDPALLEKAEARAARLGVDRAKYVRSLIEEDLASVEKRTGSTFASSDLAGMYEGSAALVRSGVGTGAHRACPGGGHRA